jgi:hypothetical protein
MMLRGKRYSKLNINLWPGTALRQQVVAEARADAKKLSRQFAPLYYRRRETLQTPPRLASNEIKRFTRAQTQGQKQKKGRTKVRPHKTQERRLSLARTRP